MPRMARIKALDSIFHVMCRSISEVDLFKTKEDKLKYIYYIRKYQKLYEFKVYGYCLMDNHVHLLIDANGADISQIMHSVNFSYAQYFNRFHKRHGHLFQDRFKSKIITDDRYLLAASAYIHNNPVDVLDYKDCPEQYEFSSLSVYLGIRQDPYNLVSSRFVLSLFGKTPKAAREKYMKFVCKCSDIKLKEEIEFENDTTEYRSQRRILVRNHNVEDAINYIANNMNIPKLKLHIKNCRKVVEAKALLVLLMRSFCNYKCSDICRNLGNITQARVSVLSSIGVELIEKNESYRRIVENFIKPQLMKAN
jgi:putative transposase